MATRTARPPLLSVATLGALASTSASAAIVYIDCPDVTVAENTGSGPSETIYFDLGTGSAWKQSDYPTGTPWHVSIQAMGEGTAHGAFAYSNMGEVSIAWRQETTFPDPYALFAHRFTDAPDQVISSALDGNWSGMEAWLADTTNPAFQGEWTNNGTSGYIALNWTVAGNNHLYGWAQVSYNTDHSVTLHDFAYEDTANTPIQAGAIPEPSTYAALTGLLAGSAALFARRRKRAA